jgi:hypothetical protein
MNQKFSFRAIQQGQTQQSHVVNAGAGQNGQALVVRAAAGTRYQLADLLTFTSPQKLQLKRVGQDLLVALPGNDVTSPDIVIKDYFNFKDLSLSGLAASGEPMVYDTSSSFNFGQSATGITPENIATNKTASATLATASGGWFDSGWGLVALGGGLALAASAGKGGSSSGDASLAKITTYKGDATKSVPSVTDFTSAGVSGIDASNITGILTLFPKTQLPLDSAASLQTLVDSFKKVVAEANGTAADATVDDPTSTDYVNLMGATTPNSISAKPQALALLNDRVKALNTTDVDSYSEIKALADSVEAIAVLAQSAPSTTGTAAAGITAAQLTSLGVDVTATSLTAVSDAIRASADDLSSLNTTAKLTALVKAYNTILAEANGTTADATTANPSAADYAAIGADIGTAKTDAAALDRLNKIVGNLTTTAVDTVDEINKLAVTLDKIQTVAALATGATLSDAQKFSVDELKNLGLTGFTGTDAQNTALALKVSEAIRDKAVADVVAGTGTGFKLDNTVKTAIDQTQLERLQALVSLEVIKNYMVDTTNSANTTIAPTLTDWQNIGVYKPISLKDTTANSAAQGYALLTSTELAYLNTAADKLAASDIDTSAKAQAVLEAYLRLVQEANGSTADANTNLNPTADDLKAVGVTGDVTDNTKKASALMLDAIANLSTDKIDTVPELQALASTVIKLMTEAAKASTDSGGTFTTTELSNLGLRGVSDTGASSNVSDFLTHVRESADNGSAIDTLAELQSLLSLSIVQAWARDVNPDSTVSPAIVKTAVTPTAQDYKDIGVVRSVAKNADASAGTVPPLMSIADVNAVNDAIDTLVDNSTSTTTDDALVNTLAKVQGIATSYFKILNEANGSASDYTTGNTVQTTFGGAATKGYLSSGTSETLLDVANIDLNINPTAADYASIGITGTFDATNNNRLSLLNTLIAEKSFGQVDTVKEIQTLANVADKVLTLAGGTGDLTLSELSTDLGLTGVNTNDLADINAAIHAASSDNVVDSFAELQSLVSFTRIQRYAENSNTASGSLNEGGALPTFATGNYTDDWKNLLGITDEVSSNYNAYNSAVDALAKTDITSLTSLSHLVTSYNNILAEANGSAADATVTDPTTTDYANIGLSLSTTGLWSNVDSANQTTALNLLNASLKTLTSDKVDTVEELRALATAVGKVIDLAEVTATATENTTNNNGIVTGLTNVSGLTMADLKLMGLAQTDKASDFSGAYYQNEAPNIYAAIQNALPTDITFDSLQTIINNRVF